MTTPTRATAPLVYLVPSRGRPGNIAELLTAWEETTTGLADIVIAVDDDDPELAGYRALELPPFATLVVGPRLRLGGTLNALAPDLATRYRGVGFMGDDHRPRTVGWDDELLCQLDATPAAVVYGNDLVQGEALPTAVLLDSLIVRTLGYYVPPGALHLFLDNFWRELGLRLGSLRYRRDVVIEHVHPITGAAAWDDGYRENNSDATWSADEATFRAYVAAELAGAADRIFTAWAAL